MKGILPILSINDNRLLPRRLFNKTRIRSGKIGRGARTVLILIYSTSSEAPQG
jgi:hypothetical protein